MQVQSHIRDALGGEQDRPRASDDVVKAWVHFVRAQQSVLARVEERLKETGFPPLEWYDVLNELDRSESGTLPQATVQSRVLLAQYNLCRLVDRMERDGLVERKQSPEDGRSNLLVITALGRSLRHAMWPVYSSAIQEHFGAHMTCAEARVLAGLFDRLTA